MRSVVLGLVLAGSAVGCSDDAEPHVVGFDSGTRDSGVSPDAGQLDARSLLDATLQPTDAFVEQDSAPTAQCTSGDFLEPNETVAAAANLTLDASGRLSLSANIVKSSPDWFMFVTPKSDPASVTVSYTLAAANRSTLSLFIVDALGSDVANDTRERESSSPTLSASFEGVAKGQYLIDIVNSDETCTPYQMQIDTAFCTDTLEDNDTRPQAKAAPSSAQALTISALDADFFLPISSTLAGGCTLQYSVGSGSLQQLTLSTFDTGDAVVSSDATGRTGAMQTLTVSWLDGANPAYVLVEASQPECTNYTLTCT